MGEGKGGTNREYGLGIYTLPCVKCIASGKLLIEQRALSQVLCDNLEWWDGVESGESFRKEEIYVKLWLI